MPAEVEKRCDYPEARQEALRMPGAFGPVSTDVYSREETISVASLADWGACDPSDAPWLRRLSNVNTLREIIEQHLKGHLSPVQASRI